LKKLRQTLCYAFLERSTSPPDKITFTQQGAKEGPREFGHLCK